MISAWLLLAFVLKCDDQRVHDLCTLDTSSGGLKERECSPQSAFMQALCRSASVVQVLDPWGPQHDTLTFDKETRVTPSVSTPLHNVGSSLSFVHAERTASRCVEGFPVVCQ